MGENPEKLTDHRDIGTQLDLFSFHDVAPGAPFWHAKGMVIWRELEKVVREMNGRDGYHEISTPILLKKEVFEKSGHWQHYRENMFYFDNPRDENEHLVVKPMNCPGSTYIYNSKVRSSRDLPLRMSEIGRTHRNELSGTLGGLVRVRRITVDDAHVYLMPDQAESEITQVIKTIDNFYKLFEFKTSYVLATKPDSALGNNEEWTNAENALKKALDSSGVSYKIAEGEGAFYGPKIEVHLDDSQGRDWQMGTAQLDLVMLAKQFEIYYTGEDGERKMPWVIHRAILGSFERFIGILLEHTGGNLPLWLSPVQVVVANISDEQLGYAGEIVDKLKAEGIRVEWYNHNDTIGKKIREAEMQKIPYIAVIGKKESDSHGIAVRKRSVGDEGIVKPEEFIGKIKKEISDKQ